MQLLSTFLLISTTCFITQCLNSQIILGLFSFIFECDINVEINQVRRALNCALCWSIFRTRMVPEIFMNSCGLTTMKRREMMLLQTTHQKHPGLMWNERLCLMPHTLNQSMSASPERLRSPETKTLCGEYPCSRPFSNWQKLNWWFVWREEFGPKPDSESQPVSTAGAELQTLLRSPWATYCFTAAQKPWSYWSLIWCT